MTCRPNGGFLSKVTRVVDVVVAGVNIDTGVVVVVAVGIDVDVAAEAVPTSIHRAVTLKGFHRRSLLCSFCLFQ